jgi:uncharacterized repeat protein (TIGR03847 family)
MSTFDLDPVERITAGAVGEPGARIFYLQAAAQGQLVTLLAEKEQVQALAGAIARLLSLLPDVEDEGPEVPADDLDLVEPLLPEWRAGSIGLDFDEGRDRLVIVFHDVEAAGEDDDEEEAVAEADAVERSQLRITATRAQARALAIRAEEVCAAGRPRCRVCGLPMDPEGHVCPGLNGHRG